MKSMSMSNKNSLKHQFKKQLALSIGLLVIIFSFLLYKLFFIGIGTTMHRTMVAMASHYAKQVELNPGYQLPNGGDYSAYIGKANVPDEVRKLFDLDEMKAFDFKVNDGNQIIKFSHPEKIYFLLAHPIANTKDKLYLLYNEVAKRRAIPPPKHGPMLNVPISIAIIILMAISLVYWVAHSLIRKVLNPINELAVMAKSLDENSPELSFEVMNDKTEIGVVANALHQTMGRIHQYHQREKQFLQNASHELRTPIAVVLSALDIIDLRVAQGNNNILDQHTNIRRANKNMAELTEALLLLSRKSNIQANVEVVNLGQLLVDIVDAHSYLLKGKSVDVELIVDESSLHDLPLALCRIVLSNLIRNAFEHTLSGTVCIQQNELSLVITNTSSGLTNDYQKVTERDLYQGQGFGIGLDIVKKIADQQKWQLQFSSSHSNGSQVKISFEQETKADLHPNEFSN